VTQIFTSWNQMVNRALSGRTSRFVSAQADPSPNDFVCLSSCKLEPNTVLIIEIQSGRNGGGAIEETNVASAVFISDEGNPLSISVVPLARRCIETHYESAGLLKPEAKSFDPDSVIDDQTGSGIPRGVPIRDRRTHHDSRSPG